MWLMMFFTGCTETDRIVMDNDVITSIKIPEGNGNPVLTDGLFSEGEWEDAVAADIHEKVTLLFKKFRGHIFIGIKLPGETGPAVDLFISPESGGIHQLHVSAQLAERILSPLPEGDDPPWVPGRTVDWYANEFRWDERKIQEIMAAENITRSQAFPQASYPCDGVELQIKASKFDGRVWRIRFVIFLPPDFENPVVYPPRSEEKNTSGWIELRLD